MKCPACGNNLEPKTADDITVQVCNGGCAGIWFESAEVQKVDEIHESVGEELLRTNVKDGVKVDHQKPHPCPKCDKTDMVRHFFNSKKEVDVDECPKCAGIWLDYGELGKIQTQFKTEEEKTGALETYFAEVFGVELEKMRKGGEKKAEQAEKVALLFRFVCPSYYIPGEKDWGSF